MKRFAQVVGVATGLSLALGTVAFTPTVATAESPFTTLGQFASGKARMAKPAWIASTGISKAAWNSALTDESVKVDETGRAFVIEPRPSASEISATTSSAAVVHTDIALADAFTLHSRPSSTHIIYLDFTGHDVTGSAWDDGATFGSGSRTVPAYDADGNPATFNSVERQTIIDTWSAVVEDYAMFNVDVTTEEPAQSEIDRANLSDNTYGVRAVITDELNPIAAGCGCGGIAYVGVYNYPWAYYSDVSYSPAFAFTRPSFNGKTISDIVSHEVGHNAGLVHDGFTPDEYYMGRNGWAPIMGAGYDEPLVQWSNGDYNSATNQEDDVAVMQGLGLPLLADDHGGTSGTATAVDLNSTTEGTIRLRSDVDYLSVVPAGNSFDVLVDLPSYSPNLDVQVAVFDSNGATIATANPNFASVSAYVATGLSASLTVSSTPGQTYYVKIDGVGFGSASSTGYSDYGSLGDYRVSITGATTAEITPTPVPTVSGRAKVGRRLTVTTGAWMEGTTLAIRWLRNGDPIRRATAMTYKLTSADSRKRISVRVTGTKSGYSTVSQTSAASARVKS